MKRKPQVLVMITPDGILVRKSTDTFADDNPLVARTLRYIRDNLGRSFGAAQIAEALNVSRSVLDKTFVAKFGHSIGEEILSRRLAKAKLLFAQSQLNVNEVSGTCGFCAPSYFIRKFTTALGMTPHQWLKRQRAVQRNQE